MQSRPNLKDHDKVCKAFEKFGWTIKHDAICRGWGWDKACKLVAVNPSTAESNVYDIAIVQDKDGVHFEHESALHFAETFGQDWGLLKQEYARLQVLEEVESRYGTCSTNTLADGTLELDIEVEVTV